MNFVRSPKMIWTGENRDTSRQSSKPETANVHQQQQQEQQHFTLHSSEITHIRNFSQFRNFGLLLMILIYVKIHGKMVIMFISQ